MTPIIGKTEMKCAGWPRDPGRPIAPMGAMARARMNLWIPLTV
jgi:hypothetical protein